MYLATGSNSDRQLAPSPSSFIAALQLTLLYLSGAGSCLAANPDRFHCRPCTGRTQVLSLFANTQQRPSLSHCLLSHIRNGATAPLSTQPLWPSVALQPCPRSLGGPSALPTEPRWPFNPVHRASVAAQPCRPLTSSTSPMYSSPMLIRCYCLNMAVLRVSSIHIFCTSKTKLGT